MWKPKSLISLWVPTVWYRNRFTVTSNFHPVCEGRYYHSYWFHSFLSYRIMSYLYVFNITSYRKKRKPLPGDTYSTRPTFVYCRVQGCLIYTYILQYVFMILYLINSTHGQIYIYLYVFKKERDDISCLVTAL
jgi:hypothetical protein